jgi:phosphatidylinositol glycan class F
MLPFFQYASTVGIHSSLLIFAVLFLPRTSLLYFPSTNDFLFAQPASSLDRPQSQFIEPLTASPVLTLSWICVGVATLAVWWAKWMRKWAYEENRYGSTKNEFELKTEKMEWQKRGSSVSQHLHLE